MNRQFQSARAGRARLRIGVVVEAMEIPRFARQVLADIAGSRFAEVVGVIVCPSSGYLDASEAASAIPQLKFGRDQPGLVYQLYLVTLDRRRRATDPVERVGFDDLVSGAQRLDIGHAAVGVDTETAQRLRALAFDVLIRFGVGGSVADLSQYARHGLWAYAYGSDPATADLPLMLREVMERRPTSRVCLQATQADGAVLDLCEARFSTSPTLSVSANRYAPLWGSTHFVIQQLNALYETGVLGHGSGYGTGNGSAAPARAAPGPPGNREMLGLIARRIGGMLKRSLGRLPEWARRGPVSLQWRIALRRAAAPMPGSPAQTDLDRFQWLDSPQGHFWADPFLFAHAGETWLFFEDYDYALDRALIGCGRLDAAGVLREVRPVLERPYHVSYPQVFEHDGEIYMVPETAQAGGVDLYRARRFPGDWVLVRRLLDVRVVDATLVHHAGRWLMFASPMAVTGHAPLTYLWSAENLLGEWRLHSSTPVCDDATRARGAGAILQQNGRLYRPSQDCASGYGRALWFNEIRRWDGETYVEHPVARVEGGAVPDLVGVHTYNRCGEWEAIDGQFRWPRRRFR
ncbi:MAG: hypothetical protein ACFCUG_00845 [Thiotrichales bacterium]